MFDVECIIKPSIFKATLLINAKSKTFVFIKLKDMYLSQITNHKKITTILIKYVFIQ
jgi:hypothetical protein